MMSVATPLFDETRIFPNLLNRVRVPLTATGRSWSRFLSEYFDLFAVKPVATKIRQLRLNRNDFEPLSLIGKGAFGEVTFNETMVRRIVGDIFTNVLSVQLGNCRQIEIKRSRLCHEDSE